MAKRLTASAIATSLVLSASGGAARALTAEPQKLEQSIMAAGNTVSFVDMAGHWAEKQVSRWSELGIVNGVDAQNFVPNKQLTRVEFFAILGRIWGGSQTADLTQFGDVDPNAWYAKDLSRAVALGLTVGDKDKNIRPNSFISREEMAVAIARVFSLNQGSSATLGKFEDGNTVSSWAAGAVSAVVDNGWMNGKGSGTFEPRANATRAEAVTVIDNAVALLVQKNETGNNVQGNVVINTAGVTLSDATVSGRLYVTQGAENGAELKNVTVKQETVVQGNVNITAGNLETVHVKTDNAVVTLDKDSKAARLIIDGENVSIKGQCKVDTIEVNASGTQIETKPKDLVIRGDVTVNVAGKLHTKDKNEDKKPVKENSSSSGSSNGNSSGSSDDQVSPHANEIVRTMMAIDERDGFRLQEIPYAEDMHNHKHGEEVGSHPFSSVYCSVGEIDKIADRYGFGEKEIFMSGRANVYTLSNRGVNVPVIKTPNVDYTTRLLIHYPENPEKFSGNVYVDILNASAGYDLEDIFRRSYEHIMKNGDIYIGITSKTITAQALKNFDAERYADIDWLVDNNDPDSQENGLFWDMLSQLGTVIKERPQDLFGAELGQKVKDDGRTYLLGQSQSGFYLQTYLMTFYPYLNNILNGKDIYDGYFNVVGATPTELSTGVKIQNVGWPKTAEPYMVMMGEAEARKRIQDGYYPMLEDKNDADWKFRLYEVAGAPHADPTSPVIPNNFEIAKANAKAGSEGTSRDTKKYQGNHVEGDVHLDEFVSAALVNLDDWARNNIAAPNGQDHWIQVSDNDQQKPALDAYGNAKGGLRSPRIDAPLATYYAYINDSDFALEGSMVHFTDKQLNARYEGETSEAKYANYLSEFKESADAALNNRYITQDDYNKFIAWSKNTSAFGHQDTEIVKSQTKKPAKIEWQNVDSKEIFDSTAMSVSVADPDWDSKAPVWMPALQLNEDGTIQYVDKSGQVDKNGQDDKLSVKYTEKEYFVSGDANLYDIASDNRLMVRESGLPYTNRILVRTPENPSDFNGRVYVDILNASDKYDNEALWRRAYGMIMEKGAAYVGITSKPVCVNALQRFDARYNALSWASPNTFLYSSYKIDKKNGQSAEEAYKKFWVNASELPTTDIGLVWDIFSQMGYALKENTDGILGKNVDVKKVYLFGQSQSGFYMNEYFRFMEFLRDNNQKLPYDGFMNVVGTYPANKINQSDATATAKNHNDMFVGKNLGVPVMYVTSQADFNTEFRPTEGNHVDEDSLFALYEIAGAPHSDPASPTFPHNDILTRMGYPARDLFPTFNQDQVMSDYNSNMFVQALLEQLDVWATNGTAPSVIDDPYLKISNPGKEQTVEGGLRSPQLDAPIAHYYEKPIGAGFSTKGTMVPFTAQELKEMYPNGFEDYKKKFDESLGKLAQKKLISNRDKAYMEKYRDSNQQLFTQAMNTSEIDLAIEAANEVKQDIMVLDLSANEVDQGQKFVTTLAMEALDTAIRKGSVAAKNTAVDEDGVTEVREALEQAIEEFKSAIEVGTKQYDSLDTSEIDTAIEAAEFAKKKVVVSNLSADQVDKDQQFVRTEVMNELELAIKVAAEAKDTVTQQSEVTEAAKVLGHAVNTFKQAVQTGTKASTMDSSGTL